MQSSEIAVQPIGSTSVSGWLESFNWLQKAPFAFLFGCVLGTATPGFDFSVVAWFGLAPLLVLLRASRSRFDATLTGFLFGLGYYLVSLNCYLGLFPLRWLGVDDWIAMQGVGLLWLVESAHQALLFAAFAWLVFCLPLRSGCVPHVHRPFFPYMLSVPLIWVFLNWVIATSPMFLGIPISQLAYTQHNAIDLIQMARIAGSGAVDYLIVLANCAVACFMLELLPLASRLAVRSDQISPRVGALADLCLVGLLVFAATTWGGAVVNETAMQVHADNEEHFYKETPDIPLAVVQPNITIEEDRQKTASAEEIAKRYTDLGSGLGVSMLVLPEGAVSTNQLGSGMLLSKLKGIVAHEKKEIIVGTVESVGDGVISAVRIIAPRPPKNSVYVEQRPAPLSVLAPFGPLGKVSPELGAPSGTASGPVLTVRSAAPIISALGKVGVSISTEVIYPNLIANQVRRGASLLVNVTNLNKFHSSSMNQQVLAAATLRAVENGRFMVVAANTGITAVIDPAGMVTSKSFPRRRGVIIDTVQFLYRQTPFSRMNRMWWL